MLLYPHTNQADYITMFRKPQKVKHKPAKGQIHGSKKPAMLATQQRRQANHAKTMPAKQAVRAEPFINIDPRHATWPVLLCIMLLIQRSFADTNTIRIIADGARVNDKGVELLPPDTRCTPNPIGISNGEICHFNGNTHYLKQFKPSASLPVSSGQHLSLEEFNLQFAKHNIGLDITRTRFYKKAADDNNIYIGSRKVDGLMFTEHKNANNRQLGKRGVARWAVASTFISDLHCKNVGYTKNGVILLDADTNNAPLTSNPLPKLLLAAKNIDQVCPALSVFDLKQMIEIYREMKSKPLPKHHDEFMLAQETYQTLLNVYIEVCDTTIRNVKALLPRLPESERTNTINTLWCNAVKQLLPDAFLQEPAFQQLCL